MARSLFILALVVSISILAVGYVVEEENFPREVKRAYNKLAKAQLRCANKCRRPDGFDSIEVYTLCMKQCRKRRKIPRLERKLLSYPEGEWFKPMIERFRGGMNSDEDEYIA
ncbi:hypothetical protein M513_10472 [Trichuris suis]|uniref:Uncharacterized protein n=1 Tax=Trichuris suis TaxID=68888 RepID=A0A085LUH1_9BILA|nr:hypothetical protein M513_10472 [Trichuris suis]